MTLAGRVGDEPERVVPGPKCGVGRLRSTLVAGGKLDEADGLTELIDAVRRTRDNMPYLNEKKWTAAAVQRVLIDEGYNISRLTVQRHVAFICACGW